MCAHYVHELISLNKIELYLKSYDLGFVKTMQANAAVSDLEDKHDSWRTAISLINLGLSGGHPLKNTPI